MATRRRAAALRRTTKETDITARLVIDGRGVCAINTGIPFFDHMLELLTRHALFDLTLKARGDLKVDYHHTVEDIGLVLGDALNRALGERRGIVRYGCAYVPMDDALSRVAIDLGGRPYLVYQVALRKQKIRDFDVRLIREFFQAFAAQGRLNLHVAQFYGAEAHHAVESMFKALARALRAACAIDPRERGVPSSKGRI